MRGHARRCSWVLAAGAAALATVAHARAAGSAPAAPAAPSSFAVGSHDGIQRAAFGRAGGTPVHIYTLTNSHGITARIMTYGAALVSLEAPDRDGRLANVVLGFASLDPYLAAVPYYGATVGRYANRIANGRFTLDGRTYRLAQNNGPNSLHGGTRGFDKHVWSADAVEPGRPALRLTYVSADGEEGYPGQLTAHVTYRLTDDDSLSIEYEAATTAPTPVNLANHAYFNLSGDPQTTILDHVLTLEAERFTPVDASLIPTGELRTVADSPFDFRLPHVIGTRIDDSDPQLVLGRGYDHNWVLSKTGSREPELAAVLTDPRSGRSMEVRTTQPGLQFYSGNFLDGKPSGSGSVFAYRTGLCLETQHFPDSPNHPAFPSTILRPGQTYRETTVLSFRVQH
ncbi:MAG TPA: aldose epimerase family protein [Steroidobacteraceae bacterium]|jgi:aldose 1-epimerase|nr:aldose epimerase family protein [Steroidobacteraceae bacterium]